jgi:GNAT superfamily N-acetyltransferase
VIDWSFELADNPNVYTPLGPHDLRIETARYVLFFSVFGGCVAQRFRFAEAELDDVRAEIHSFARERSATELSWEIGSGASPAGLAESLLALGLVEQERQVGMALSDAPAEPPPADVEVRKVTTPEENFESSRIAAIAFGGPVPTEVRPFTPSEDNVIYLAYVDGQPVARASGAFGPHGATLFGGSTLPDARGRGAYRALVAARWADAAERGTPLLVTQASSMSRPILERLGFRQVCELRALLDRFA